jgi:hypothetical protein
MYRRGGKSMESNNRCSGGLLERRLFEGMPSFAPVIDAVALEDLLCHA